MKTPRVFRTLIFISLLACLPAHADEKRDKFDAQFRQAQALFKQDKLAEAYAAVQAAARVDPSRYEASGFAALVLLKDGKITAAREALADARKLAPAEAKQKLDEIGKLIETTAAATPAGTTTSFGNVSAQASATAALAGAARRKYDTLLVIVEEADKAKSPDERKNLLGELMEKSGEFVREHPDFIKVWTLRAAAALEMEQQQIAREAGTRLLLLGAEESNDPKTRQLVAKIDRKGWLPTAQQMSEMRAADAAVKAATKDRPFVNSLSMKFVPVPGTTVLFSIWETRVQDFEAFVRATGHDATAEMNSLTSDKWKKRGDSWKSPGFSQGPTHPVCGVSWEDAQAFCRWLSQKEGKTYRLPTDAEWSTAVGLEEAEYGTPYEKKKKGRTMPVVYPWGTGFPPPASAGNYAGVEAVNSDWPSDKRTIENYRDGFARTSPVGSFEKNRLGLFDLGGNVWEWCEDRPLANSGARVLRGGSWSTGPHDAPSNASPTLRELFLPTGLQDLLSSCRSLGMPSNRSPIDGFRVVVSAFSLGTATAQMPKTFDDHVRQAKTYFEDKNISKAFIAIMEAEKLEPNNYRAPALAATIFLEMRKFDGAKQSITRALRLAPPDGKAKLDQLAKTIDQAMSPTGSDDVIVVPSLEEMKRGAKIETIRGTKTETSQNLSGSSTGMNSVPEKTIQQTLTISSESPRQHPYDIEQLNRLRENPCIECKALTVGPNGTAVTTITLAGYPANSGQSAQPATAYPNGMCKTGMPLRHLMLRVASANPEYKWIGAWILPGGNPFVHFHENGQVAYAVTARSWLDLKPDRIALPENTLVRLDSDGVVIQAWPPRKPDLFPGRDNGPLPGTD